MLHNTSSLLKIISAVTLAAVVGISLYLFKSAGETTVQHEHDSPQQENGEQPDPHDPNYVNLNDGTRVYVGDEVDSRVEVINDVFTRVQDLEISVNQKMNTYGQQLNNIENQLQSLQTTNSTPNQALANQNLQTYTELQDSFISKITNLEGEINKLKGKPTNNSFEDGLQDTVIVDENDLPIGVNNSKFAMNRNEPRLVDPDEVDNNPPAKPAYQPAQYDTNQWVYPINATQQVDEKTGETKISTPDINAYRKATLDTRHDETGKGNDKQEESAPIPMATIPDGATLLQSRTLTALVGRVPVGNQVIDPYPFKLVVGKNNLASNYKRIPGIDGVIVQGKTRGNRTLQCVFAEVTKLTFTFVDGRVVTLPKQTGNSNGSSRASAPVIGYLSDDQGVPCISGINISNRTEYITQVVALDAFQAGARALADNERTRISDNGTVTETVTGDGGRVIFGEMLAGGAEAGANVAADFMNEAFEAVYVPNNRFVSLHLEQQIEIDYDLNGRKIFYGNQIPGLPSGRVTGRL